MKEPKLDTNAEYLQKLDELTKITRNPEKISHISPMGEPVTSHPTTGGYVVDERDAPDPHIEDLARIGIEELGEPELFVAIDPKVGGGYGKIEEERDDELVVTIIQPEPETEDTVENRQRNKEGDTVTVSKEDVIPLNGTDVDDIIDHKDDVSYESFNRFDEVLSQAYNNLHRL